MDARSELLALRAEFKSLGESFDPPNAQYSWRSDGYSEWTMKGNSYNWRLFKGLATRAAVAMGADGWQAWMDRLAREHPLDPTYEGVEGGSIEHFGGWLQNPSRLSVETIDGLLVALSIAPQTGGGQSEGDADSQTINERMYATLGTRPESQGWSCQRWADELGCVKSSIAESAAWGSLKVVKADAKVRAGARPKDKRRKPKASDTKRD